MSKHRPARERLLSALQDITEEGGTWASASDLAYRAGIEGERRHGNGAVKGSWSGYTAPGFVASRVLRGMVARGEVRSRGTCGRDYPTVYALPVADAVAAVAENLR